MKYRWLQTLLLTSALIGICTATLELNALALDTNWQSEYEAWLISQKPSATGGDTILLYDLDLDGSPELFYGIRSFGHSLIENMFTFKNREMQPLTVREEGTEGTALCISNILEAEMYYEPVSQTVSFFSPRLVERGISARRDWFKLTYKNNKIYLSKPLGAVSYEEKPDHNYAADDWQWNSSRVNEEAFNSQVQAYWEPRLRYSYPAMHAARAPENPWFDIWVNSDENETSVDTNRLHEFLYSWSPGVVLGKLSANPTQEQIEVDRVHYSVDTYQLFNNNYIRLRDAAELLAETDRRFNVIWDGTYVQLVSGAAYKNTDASVGASSNIACLSDQPILLDGKRLEIATYQISDTNYVKLRDIMDAMGCAIHWNEEEKLVEIVTV